MFCYTLGRSDNNGANSRRDQVFVLVRLVEEGGVAVQQLGVAYGGGPVRNTWAPSRKRELGLLVATAAA